MENSSALQLLPLLLDKKVEDFSEETLRAFAEAITSKEGYKGPEGFIKVTGDERTQKLFDHKNFSGKMNRFVDEINKMAEHGSQELEVNNDGDAISVAASQDKVDVTFSIQTEDYNLNIKNYNLANSKAITLHSGNVLKMIQSETSFINHYLNIMSTRIDGKGAIHGSDFSSSLRERARQTIKTLLFIKGLTGGVLVQGKTSTRSANYFLVNDNSKGKIHLYDMDSVIYLALNNQGLNSKVVHVEGFQQLEKIKNRFEVGEENTKTSSGMLAYRRVRRMVEQLYFVSVIVKMDIEHLNRLNNYLP